MYVDRSICAYGCMCMHDARMYFVNIALRVAGPSQFTIVYKRICAISGERVKCLFSSSLYMLLCVGFV